MPKIAAWVCLHNEDNLETHSLNQPISILVCRYKPEIYPKKKMGAVSIISYEGVASNLPKSKLSKLHTYIIGLGWIFNKP